MIFPGTHNIAVFTNDSGGAYPGFDLKPTSNSSTLTDSGTYQMVLNSQSPPKPGHYTGYFSIRSEDPIKGEIELTKETYDLTINQTSTPTVQQIRVDTYCSNGQSQFYPYGIVNVVHNDDAILGVIHDKKTDQRTLAVESVNTFYAGDTYDISFFTLMGSIINDGRQYEVEIYSGPYSEDGSIPSGSTLVAVGAVNKLCEAPTTSSALQPQSQVAGKAAIPSPVASTAPAAPTVNIGPVTVPVPGFLKPLTSGTNTPPSGGITTQQRTSNQVITPSQAKIAPKPTQTHPPVNNSGAGSAPNPSPQANIIQRIFGGLFRAFGR